MFLLVILLLRILQIVVSCRGHRPSGQNEKIEWRNNSSGLTDENLANQTVATLSSEEDHTSANFNNITPPTSSSKGSSENKSTEEVLGPNGTLKREAHEDKGKTAIVAFNATLVVIVIGLVVGWAIFQRYERWKRRQAEEAERVIPQVSYTNSATVDEEESVSIQPSKNRGCVIPRSQATSITPNHRVITVPNSDFAWIATSDFVGQAEILRKIPLRNKGSLSGYPSIFEVLTSPVRRTNCKNVGYSMNDSVPRRWSLSAADDLAKLADSPYYRESEHHDVGMMTSYSE